MIIYDSMDSMELSIECPRSDGFCWCSMHKTHRWQKLYYEMRCLPCVRTRIYHAKHRSSQHVEHAPVSCTSSIKRKGVQPKCGNQCPSNGDGFDWSYSRSDLVMCLWVAWVRYLFRTWTYDQLRMLCTGTDAEIGWPAAHDDMLIVGNSELNYSSQFCMSCLEKIMYMLK